jgi:hypothetical protein
MRGRSFVKVLSANDVGATGSHQAGMHIPLSESEVISFFPPLDSSFQNPDCLLICVDENGSEYQFRYVYYNNKLHATNGTRNERRITCVRSFFRNFGASEGDSVRFEALSDGRYKVSIKREEAPPLLTGVVRLTGWRREH